MARSSSSDAMASCLKPHATVNASVTSGEIVSVLMERRADGVDVAERHEEFERARKQAFPLKQLQQPPGVRLEKPLAHRWHHDRARVDQQLCARRAGEVLFADRVEAVAIGARGESQQAALLSLSCRARKAMPDIQPAAASGVRRRCRE